MKSKLFLLILSLFILFSCTKSEKKQSVNFSKKKQIKAKYERLSSEIVIGDFDGDKVIDTLSELHFFGKQEKLITEIPLFEEYEDQVDYYYKHHITTTLKSNKKSIKSLKLGVSFGTYCLINIGDNNNDGKDELAVVIAYCDFSMMNSCKIYSLCDSNWKMINHFAVHENSFLFEEGEKLDPTKIKDYLEQKKGKWFYADAWELLNADDTLSKMKPLKINKCN